jgi:hypothetical protein
MERFLAMSGGKFIISGAYTLEYEIGYFTHESNTTREVWNIYITPRLVNPEITRRWADRRFGMILATESQPGERLILSTRLPLTFS